MNKTRWLASSFLAATLLTTSACVTDPNTGEKKISRTAIGGVGGVLAGGLLGGLIGGKTGRIVGAGIGGVGRIGVAHGSTFPAVWSDCGHGQFSASRIAELARCPQWQSRTHRRWNRGGARAA